MRTWVETLTVAALALVLVGCDPAVTSELGSTAPGSDADIALRSLREQLATIEPVVNVRVSAISDDGDGPAVTLKEYLATIEPVVNVRVSAISDDGGEPAVPINARPWAN